MPSLSAREVEACYSAGFFSAIDIHFARLMAGLSKPGDPALLLAAALVSRQTMLGHVCLDLSAAALQCSASYEQPVPITCPAPEHWAAALRASPVVGTPGEYRPLILDTALRLYLYRYWDYEQRLANALKQRSCVVSATSDRRIPAEALRRYFPDNATPGVDCRQLAALAALTRQLTVICGGPGTGKTTTVARILALLVEHVPGLSRIALAAPTGKAADRLHRAISQTKAELPAPAAVISAIPDQAATLHRLLGSLPGTAFPHYTADHPLPFDIVVVDEASMVDLPMMSKLFQALGPEARIILVGDKDQLASVECGTVLGDICSPEPQAEAPALADAIVELKINYRFGTGSGIARLSKAVNSGDAEEALRLLRGSQLNDIAWLSGGIEALRSEILNGLSDYARAADLDRAMQLFERFRILCALRIGPSGSAALNSMAERTLADEGLLRPATTWYHKRPVMITRNDYNLKLFNGDIGIVFQESSGSSSVKAFFPTPEHGLRSLPPARLPDVETAYAMTVHKSQGSEFDGVLLVLPAQDSPVLTRELIYTAITRARQRVMICGSEEVFRLAVGRTIRRASGLRDALAE